MTQIIQPLLPTEILPPNQMIGEHTNRLAKYMADRMVRSTPSLNLNDTVQDNLSIFRLIVIHDNLRGIAAPLPNMPKTSACLYFFEKMVNTKNNSIKLYLEIFQKILLDTHTLKEFPDLDRPPAKKRTEHTSLVNPLLGMVFSLAKAPGFSVLFPDIYEVCVGLYSKLGWDTSSDELDNLECSMRRVIPNISLKLSVAIHNTIEHHGNPMDLHDAIWAEAESIPSVNGGELERNTRIGYFRDFYDLFFHLKKIKPPNQSDERKDRPPTGSNPPRSTHGKGSTSSKHGYPGGEDEENQAIEKYCTEYDKLSETAALELNPGDAIESIDRSSKKDDDASHTHTDLDARLAVEAQATQFDSKCIPFVILLRIWNLVETTSAAENKYFHITAMNYLQPLLGWGIDQCRAITRRKKWSNDQSGIANYDKETHIIEIPIQLWDGYPEFPQNNPELYVPVQNKLSLGMPEPIANLLDILANQVKLGASLFPKEKKVYLELIDHLNIEKNVHRPKGMQTITEARLRNTFWPLLVGVGGLDPLIASFLSQHWIAAAKTPAYYSTLSSPFISQEYSSALQKAVNYLATHNYQHLPTRFLTEFTAPIPPTTYIGSPYRPAPGVIEAAVDKLQSAINATSDEVIKHNYKTVLVILALDYLCGLRRNETFCLNKDNYTKVFELAGLTCGFITLTDDIAKSCGFCFGGRLIPIPRKIEWALWKIANRGDGPLFRYQTGPGQFIPMTIDLFDSIIDSLGIELPRYHDGRHWLHCTLQEIDADHQLGFFGINLILGHQTTGQEALGRFNDTRWVKSWCIYLSLADQLADLIGWRLQD